MNSLCCLGKCWSRRLRKRLAILVLSCLLYEGLNQINFLFRLSFFLCSFHALYFRFTFLHPLSFKAFSYSVLAELKTCFLQELLDNLSSIESGTCFIIWVGWFEEVHECTVSYHLAFYKFYMCYLPDWMWHLKSLQFLNV